VSGPFILVCAATSFEARACHRGVARAGKGKALIEVLRTGMGSDRAARALRERLERGSAPAWIVSSGFAGSRRADLGLGSWIIGTRVGDAIGDALDLSTEPFPSWLETAGMNPRPASLHMVSEVVTSEEGAAGDAVDMESFCLARIAREFGARFLVLRLISDTPAQPIPQAIREFSSLGLHPRSLRGAAAGLLAGAREPRQLARFVGRTLPLTRELERAWERIAHAVMPSSARSFGPSVRPEIR
jgi:nucleoside phosphorylase